MIEFILLAQMTTSQPQQQYQYQAPTYQQPQTQQQPTRSSVPTQKQIEQTEESIFDHPG